MDMFTVSDLWSYYCPKAQKFYDKLEVWLRRAARELSLTLWTEHIPWKEVGRQRSPQSRGLGRLQPRKAASPAESSIKHSVHLRSCLQLCVFSISVGPLLPTFSQMLKHRRSKYSRQWARDPHQKRSVTSDPIQIAPHCFGCMDDFKIQWTAKSLVCEVKGIRFYCCHNLAVWLGINCLVSQLLHL